MLSFSCDRKTLADAITRASQGLSSRPQNPVHAGMLIATSGTGLLLLTASDGDVTFTASCDAAISDSESVILTGKMLAEISRYFTGNSVQMECDATTAVITAGKSRFTLSISPGEKYPSWSKTPEPLGKLDAEVFSNTVKAIHSSVSRINPVMRGIRCELEGDRLLMTATDGSRMAFASPAVTLAADISPPAPILAPGAVLDRFSRVAEGEVSFGWGTNLLGLWTEGLEVVTPLIAGEFHKSWVMIRDDYDPKVTVSVPELTQMVKMATLAAGDQGTVKLGFCGSITVSASGDAGYSGVLEGNPFGISSFPEVLEFTPQYLLDGLQGEKASLSYTGRALLIERDDGSRCLIQPRRRTTGAA